MILKSFSKGPCRIFLGDYTRGNTQTFEALVDTGSELMLISGDQNTIMSTRLE